MKILEKSLQIAQSFRNASQERFFHVCFIYDKQRLLSIGFNNTQKENSKVRRLGKHFRVKRMVDWSFPHAETAAIDKLYGKQMITNSEKVVVLRLGRRGQLLQSKPCAACSSMLKALGFANVYYSVNDNIVEGEL